MNFKPEIVVALSVGFIPYVINATLWFVSAEKKKYAAERDFQHLKNNQKDISSGIASLGKDIDDYMHDLNRDILEIKLKLDIEIPRPKPRKNKDDNSNE
ncbi:MAG: hypothetical protein KME54_23230 [Tolypothrix brevis GSE-NOS-MK-07-07A]|jgi:peptidoglycan hydrolase CwlO-like protein|nr:hypothetical protein [Tolypothrix brevis GSE-NOS-MK-07-07A]